MRHTGSHLTDGSHFFLLDDLPLHLPQHQLIPVALGYVSKRTDNAARFTLVGQIRRFRDYDIKLKPFGIYQARFITAWLVGTQALLIHLFMQLARLHRMHAANTATDQLMLLHAEKLLKSPVTADVMANAIFIEYRRGDGVDNLLVKLQLLVEALHQSVYSMVIQYGTHTGSPSGGGFSGSLTVKVEPTPASLVNVISPPCLRIILDEIESPRPVPLPISFVV